MLDTDLDRALIDVRDLGLGDPPRDAVDVCGRAALQQEIERELRGSRPRPRWRLRRGVVVALTALLVAGIGTAGYAALTSSSTSSAGIECHAGATLDSSGTIVALDGRSATEICAQLWASGEVGDGVRAAPAPLRACVPRDGDGAIHVFASNDPDICANVGLRDDSAAGANPEAAQYGRFAAAIGKQLNSPAFACPSASEVRELVEAALREHGLMGWTVTDAGGYDATRPCAALALDSDTRTAALSPIGR